MYLKLFRLPLDYMKGILKIFVFLNFFKGLDTQNKSHILFGDGGGEKNPKIHCDLA